MQVSIFISGKFLYILHERQVPQAVRLSDSRKKAAFAAHLSIFFLQSGKDRETAVGNDPVEAMEYLANTVREEEGISRVNEAKRSAPRAASAAYFLCQTTSPNLAAEALQSSTDPNRSSMTTSYPPSPPVQKKR